MPVAAAAILQRIADFLAVGASPVASTEAGDGFSVHLARNAAAPAANQTDETGNTLPLDRQDLAARTADLPTTNLDLLSQPALDGETMPTTTASTDVLPSTAAMLIATDPLPKAVIASTVPETQDAPAQDDAVAPQANAKALATEASTPAAQQPAMAPIVERLIASASIESQPAADIAVAPPPITQPTTATPKPAKPTKLASNEHAHAHAPVSTSADTTSDNASVTVATSTPTAVPQAVVLPQTADGSQAEPMPVASPVATAPTVAIQMPASTTIASVAAETPETSESADIVLPSQRLDAKPPVSHADHHPSRMVKAGSQPIRGESTPPKSEASTADATPVAERLTTMPSPILATTTDAPVLPASATSRPTADPAQPTSTAPAVAAPIIAPMPQAITTEAAAPQMRSADLPASHADTAATAAARTTVDQPAVASTGNATAPAQPAAATVTNPTPAATTAGVTFVARSTRPITDRTPAPQPVETAAPTTKAETVAPVAANATAAPEREALPFRTTARQILAAQPAAADAPRAAEAETRVRAPAAEAAPTIAQHLAPASHGGERIIATAAPAPTMSLSTEQAAALVETIQMLRSEAKSDAMTLAVDHAELGKITMRFDRTDHGVAVRIDSPDPSVNQLIANSAPALRASGDGVGMRFDRQDAQGSGAGTSRDAPRQGAGQDRNPTPYSQSSTRPRASGQRDGLFA